MNSYYETKEQPSSNSIFLWLISLGLLISSITAWYFYMNTDNDLKNSQRQKQRVQKQYSQKSNELYASWDKLQKKQNENYQLMSQIEECRVKTAHSSVLVSISL